MEQGLTHSPSFLNSGAYVQLKETWSSEQGGTTSHLTILDAKRWCSQIGNCFGTRTNHFDPTGELIGAVSMEFPVLLRYEVGMEHNIHKKEQIIGIILSMFFNTASY